jgi:hypothetical protein
MTRLARLIRGHCPSSILFIRRDRDQASIAGKLTLSTAPLQATFGNRVMFLMEVTVVMTGGFRHGKKAQQGCHPACLGPRHHGSRAGHVSLDVVRLEEYDRFAVGYDGLLS